MAYPSKRTPEVEAEILRLLSSGKPLAEICRSDERFPNPSTWRDWCDEDQALAIAYARARDDGFDAIAVETLSIADTPLEGVRVKIAEDGKTEETREDMLGHRKLQIETRLKLLAKWDPKRYGDKTLVGSDPENPLPQGFTVNLVKSK